jgi:hypothetical protein
MGPVIDSANIQFNFHTNDEAIDDVKIAMRDLSDRLELFFPREKIISKCSCRPGKNITCVCIYEDDSEEEEEPTTPLRPKTTVPLEPCPFHHVRNKTTGECLECPDAAKIVNDECVCPTNYVLQDDKCMQCAFDTYSDNNTCKCARHAKMQRVSIIVDAANGYGKPACICPPGARVRDDECVCPIGARLEPDGCKCPNGSVMESSMGHFACICEQNHLGAEFCQGCPIGSIVNHNKECKCPHGATLVNNRCACPKLKKVVANTYTHHFDTYSVNGECTCGCVHKMHFGTQPHWFCPSFEIAERNGCPRCPIEYSFNQNGMCL